MLGHLSTGHLSPVQSFPVSAAEGEETRRGRDFSTLLCDSEEHDARRGRDKKGKDTLTSAAPHDTMAITGSEWHRQGEERAHKAPLEGPAGSVVVKPLDCNIRVNDSEAVTTASSGLMCQTGDPQYSLLSQAESDQKLVKSQPGQ